MKKRTVTRESPAVERVRAARRALAKDCNYDVDKLGQALMERQDKSKHKCFVTGKKPAHV
jgi:hypothetical protein